MSLYDYQQSKYVDQKDVPFYALIMGAMRRADDINLAKLKAAWPEVYIEFVKRYNAPGGLIDGEGD